MVEFALLVPILLTLSVGIADTAQGLARKFELEQASYRVLELVTVGSFQSDYAYIKPDAAAAANVPEDNVTVVNWLECDGARKEVFSSTCLSTQQTGRFLQVTIVDDFRPTFVFGPLGEAFTGNADGKIRLTARSTIRIQ